MVVSDLNDCDVFDISQYSNLVLKHNMLIDSNLYGDRFSNQIHLCQGNTLYTIYRYTVNYKIFKYNCGCCFRLLIESELPNHKFIIDCDPWSTEDEYNEYIIYTYNYINDGLINITSTYNNLLMFTDRFIYTDNKMFKLMNNKSNVRLPINIIIAAYELLISNQKNNIILN